jgi:hypothetical protein
MNKDEDRARYDDLSLLSCIFKILREYFFIPYIMMYFCSALKNDVFFSIFTI